MVCCEQWEPHFFIVFTYLFVLCTASLHVVTASNNSTLKPGDILDFIGMLCSENGTYCMDFSPEYLRIYAKRKDDWVVWTANRDQPADPASATLSLNHSGVLKIESKNETLIILYSPPQPVNNTVATLLDTGNFVLKQLHPNGTTKSILWQSFDFPTDSLLPGMKIGINHKTGHHWSLVSSFSGSIPAPGPFKLDWEPKTRELVITRGKQVYWRSGELRNKRFEHISADAEYQAVSNEEDEYFTLTTPSDEELTKWTLLETGQLINRKGNNIARVEKCYGYNTNDGCQKWEGRPTCRARGDGFEPTTGYTNFKTATNVVNESYGISDCQAMCWSNCRCVGFASFNNNGTGCRFYSSKEGINIAGGGESFYLLVNTHHKGSKWWMWMGGAIATVLLIIVHSIVCHNMTKRRYARLEKIKRMRTEMQDLEASGGSTSNNDLQVSLNSGDDLTVFSYASIMVATNGFSSNNKLGQGGFGPVFKGILPSGQEVAVKKLSTTSGQGVVEFKNELTLISKLQHTNLVQLIGHCIHQQDRMLVYEYMPNRSLDCFLFDSAGRKLLDWSKRFSIIEGIAQGLLYLHKYSRLKIIHRDLKASNILLDENMNPKISDFGVARMFTKQETESNTNRIVGTYGYMSPEYAMEGVFSTKSDVYSFGVLLLEIISGRRNNSLCSEERSLNLVGHAWELWKEGVVLHVVDPALNNSFSEDEVLRCVHVGLLCVEDNADDRPTMSNVILMLANKTKLNTLPKKPAYYVRTSLLEDETFGVDSTFENVGSDLHTV